MPGRIMSEPAEPRAQRADLTKLRIERGEQPPPGRSPIGLALAFVLGATAGGAGVWFGAPRLREAPRPAPAPAAASSATAPASASSTPSAAPAPAAPAADPDAPILSASGYIIARREAEVGSKVPGRLLWLGVEAGSEVKEGEVIARLESTDYRAELEVARASLDRADRLAQRLKSGSAVFSADEIDAAEADVKVGRARLAVVEARLADTVIKAPFAGRVVEKRAEIGVTVSPLATTGQLTPTGIARFVDFSTIEAEIEVSERYVRRLAEGQPAIYEVTAFPGKRWRGELRQVIPTSSREKSVVEVRVTLLERDEGLLPGMATKVTFYERTPPP